LPGFFAEQMTMDISILQNVVPFLGTFQFKVHIGFVKELITALVEDSMKRRFDGTHCPKLMEGTNNKKEVENDFRLNRASRIIF